MASNNYFGFTTGGKQYETATPAAANYTTPQQATAGYTVQHSAQPYAAATAQRSGQSAYETYQQQPTQTTANYPNASQQQIVFDNARASSLLRLLARAHVPYSTTETPRYQTVSSNKPVCSTANANYSSLQAQFAKAQTQTAQPAAQTCMYSTGASAGATANNYTSAYNTAAATTNSVSSNKPVYPTTNVNYNSQQAQSAKVQTQTAQPTAQMCMFSTGASAGAAANNYTAAHNTAAATATNSAYVQQSSAVQPVQAAVQTSMQPSQQAQVQAIQNSKSPVNRMSWPKLPQQPHYCEVCKIRCAGPQEKSGLEAEIQKRSDADDVSVLQKELVSVRTLLNDLTLKREAEKETLEKQLEDIQETCLKLQAEKKELENINKGLPKKDEIANLRGEIDGMSKTLSQVRKEVEVQKEDRKSLSVQLADFIKGKLAEKNCTIEDLQRVSTEKDELIAKLKNESEALQKNMEEMKKERAQISTKIEEWEGSNAAVLQLQEENSNSSLKVTDEQNSKLETNLETIKELQKALLEKEAQSERFSSLVCTIYLK